MCTEFKGQKKNQGGCKSGEQSRTKRSIRNINGIQRKIIKKYGHYQKGIIWGKIR